MRENKRFRKVMGFIQDNTCKGGDVEGVMDLTEIEDMLNRLNDKNIELHIQNNFLKVENQHVRDLIIENRRLKEQIKNLRLGVLDSIHEAEDIQCCCNPCVVEECVKKVVG